LVSVQLLGQLQVAASKLCVPSCFCRRQALPKEFLFEKLKVYTDLVFKLRIGLSTTDEVPKLRESSRDVYFHARIPSKRSRSTSSDILLQCAVSFSKAFRPADVMA